MSKRRLQSIMFHFFSTIYSFDRDTGFLQYRHRKNRTEKYIFRANLEF